jgi:hypothetical protein
MRVPETTVCHSPVIPALISDKGKMGISSSARAGTENDEMKTTVTAQKPEMNVLIFMAAFWLKFTSWLKSDRILILPLPQSKDKK